MPSLAHRLTCFALAFLLSGSPAALSACMALCLICPPSETGATDVPQADHKHHGVAVDAPPASPHAHHGSEASREQVTTAAKASPPSPSDARVVGGGESCCVVPPLAIAVARGLEWTDAKVFGMALAAQVTLFRENVRPPAAAPPSPPVTPPSPTRAPLALRI